MSCGNFRSDFPLISNGEDVAEDTDNRPLEILRENCNYLFCRMEQAALGSALVTYNVTIDDSVEVGEPVYLDAESLPRKYKRSRLRFEVVDGMVVTYPETEVHGILVNKTAADAGDILLDGVYQVSLVNSVGQAQPTGKHYLSPVAGKLTDVRQALPVPVLISDGSGKVLFRPWFAETYPLIRSFKVDLTLEPSGTSAVAGGLASITDPDAELPGWLPANHVSFGGVAPSGAKFGYNLAADEVLSGLWPPNPIQATELFFDRGDDECVGATEILRSGLDLVQVDVNGIWWMTACDDQVPWDATNVVVEAPSECPRQLHRVLTVSLFRIQTPDSAQSVRSLQSRNTLLKLYARGTTIPASFGDLDALVDLGSLIGPTVDDTLGLSVKQSIDGVLTRGPVVSGLKTSGTGLTLSGGSVLGDYRYGQLTLQASSQIAGNELTPSQTALKGATQESYQDRLALGFPPGRNSSFRSAILIPTDLVGVASLTVVLKFWVLSTATGTLPPLTLGYRVLTRPTGGATAMPPTDTTLPLSTYPFAPAANEYVEIVSDAITVPAGAILEFELRRDAAGAGDGYGGEVHILRQYGTITGTSA